MGRAIMRATGGTGTCHHAQEIERLKAHIEKLEDMVVRLSGPRPKSAAAPGVKTFRQQVVGGDRTIEERMQASATAAHRGRKVVAASGRAPDPPDLKRYVQARSRGAGHDDAIQEARR
jgi:hypothetical protein